MKKVIAIRVNKIGSLNNMIYVSGYNSSDIEADIIQNAIHFNSYDDAEKYIKKLPLLPPKDWKSDEDYKFGNSYVIEIIYIINEKN